MSEDLEYSRITVLQASPPLVGKELCHFVLGVPLSTRLELQKQYPDRGYAGRNPKVAESILSGISEREKERIRFYLRIESSVEISFRYDSFNLNRVDYDGRQPTFDGDDGKKFWV